MNEITNNELKCTIARAALQHVEDPEIGLNVIDLGLIYQIDFDETERQIYVSMTLTTQFCPMGASISSAVKQALEQAFPGEQVLVNVVFDPPWNNSRISPEGRAFLNR